MAILLLGSPIARAMIQRVKRRVSRKNLCLGIVQVGMNQASQAYLKEKQKSCEEAGIRFRLTRFSQATSQEKLKQEIKKLSQSPLVHGIVIQLPLPSHIDAQEICDEIPVEKDPDILSSVSFGMFALGKLSIFDRKQGSAKQVLILPPTVGAVSTLFKHYRISVLKKRILLVGAGRLVGLPLAIWLLSQKAHLVVATKETRNIAALAKKADVIISGAGVSRLITGTMIKKGCIVIDAGTSVEEGVTRGDVDNKSVAPKAAFLAPVPGGLGPLTVACLLENLTQLSDGQSSF